MLRALLVADGPLSAKLVKQSTFKVYPGRPHGVCQTEPDLVNRDLLAFIKGERLAAVDGTGGA